VTIQALEREVGIVLDSTRELHHIPRREAYPAHPGINLDMHRSCNTALARFLVQGVQQVS
jgi:hypothetical protein